MGRIWYDHCTRSTWSWSGTTTHSIWRRRSIYLQWICRRILHTKGYRRYRSHCQGKCATESVTRERISRAELFFTGFAEGLKLTHFPPTTGPTYTLSGAASDIAFVSDYDGAELFVVSGTIIEDFTPHWRSPLQRDGIVTPVDYGSITQTPIPEDIDYGFVRLVAFRAEDYKYIIPGFKSVEILGESTEAYSRSSYLGIGTYFLSDFADAPRAYDYESSGITGIATYKAGINIFGANWFSQAPQHTVFGLEGSFTIQGSGAESITPTTEIGSGSLFTIGGISETTAVNPPAAGTKFISGSAKVNPVPAPKGSGTITISQGREEGQTYLRIIDVGTTFGLFGITGSSIEKNTEHYNRSSIKYGQENENFGQIFGTDPSFGFDLQYKGIQSSSVEDYSEGTLTFDNSDQIGRTYDEAVGGAGVLPTFDKTNQYNVNFSSTVVSEDWGEIEDNANTVGGPSYDQELYPYNTGFIDQRGIDAGYFDYGWINEDTQDPPKVPFEPPARIIDAVPRAKTMWIPSFPGSGTVLFDISSATESITVFERADVPLLPLSGSGDEAVVWQSPERTVTILTSGTATESLTKVDVGIGTLATITGELVERVRFEEVGSGTISLVGIATEKLISNPPEGTSLFTPYGSYSNFSAAYSEVADKAVLRLSGELVHPDIDYTPHYGIDRNIGIETGFTLSSGGGLNEDGTVSGIVTTRFIPDYPAAGTIFIEGKAIGRTNAPILTDGTIYILGIGTEPMVLSMMTLELVTSMVSSLVRRNASFLQLSKRVLDSSTLLELHQTDQSVSLDTMETTEIQHIWYDHDLYRDRSNSLPRSYQVLAVLLVLVHSLELSISEKPMLTMVLVLSTQSVEAQKHSGSSSWSRYTVRIWSLWCCRAYSAQTPENVVTLTLSGDAQETLLITNEYFGTVYASGEHIQPEQDLMLHLVLSSPSRVVQNPSHLLSPPSQFLSHWWRICKQTNSGLWILRRRQRSEHIWNNFDCWGTYPSKHRLYSSSRRYRSIQLHWRIYFCLQNHRNYHWWYCNTIWFCRRIVYLGRRRTDTTLQNCWGWRNCSQLCIWLLWRRQGSWYIWSGNNFWYWRYQKNPSIRILRRRQRSWNFRKTSTFFHDSCSSICRLHSISRWFWSIQDYWSRNSPSFPTSTGDWIPLRYRIGRRGYARSTYVGIGNITIETFTPTIIERVQFEEGRTFVVII